MAMITQGGKIHFISTKKGKQKGLITVGGQLSTLIPYLPSDVIAPTGYGNTVMGVASGDISKVMGVATADISKVFGI
tara:strand:- start:1247 stop:1477 length:231 start_codon:yes stop_codon:yes gene_type:complete